MRNRNATHLGTLIPGLFAGLLCLLPACNVVQQAQDDPTRYFVLSDPAVPPAQAPAGAAGLRIGLRQVRLEAYLRKRDMVVRTGENEVQFRDYRLWAEPLDAGITRVLRTRLLASAEVAQVYAEPFPADQERDYDVSVEVRRCEGSMAASGRYSASFSATIEVSTSGASPRVVAHKVFVAPEAAWDGRDFDRLASLLTADVAALGQEILSDVPARN
jgi:uncharacterized lipoprotein YmbA